MHVTTDDEHTRITPPETRPPTTHYGITVMCLACGARRDWMVICDVPGRIFIRCRCAHQWHEPELGRADYDRMIGEGSGRAPRALTLSPAMPDSTAPWPAPTSRSRAVVRAR